MSRKFVQIDRCSSWKSVEVTQTKLLQFQLVPSYDSLSNLQLLVPKKYSESRQFTSGHLFSYCFIAVIHICLVLIVLDSLFRTIVSVPLSGSNFTVEPVTVDVDVPKVLVPNIDGFCCACPKLVVALPPKRLDVVPVLNKELDWVG